MKKHVYIMIALFVFAGVAFAASDTKEQAKAAGMVTGAHLESGLTCADCHGTDTPEKKASQKTCIECHSDMTSSAPIKFKSADGADFKVSPHSSHAGQMRCTLCHATHTESKLYCNEGCHHKFVLPVP